MSRPVEIEDIDGTKYTIMWPSDEEWGALDKQVSGLIDSLHNFGIATTDGTWEPL